MPKHDLPLSDRLKRLKLLDPLSDDAYRAGLTEGFRRGVQAAVGICEQTFNDEREAGDTDENCPDNAWSRICAKRIRALRLEEGQG